MGKRNGTWAVGMCVALWGCPSAELAPLEPCTVSGVLIEVPQRGVDKVDLLFVVDDSGSMEQEQRALGRELPRMARILATGDLDLDGEPDFPPVQDMHLGLVSTDLGAAGNDPHDSNGCAAPGWDGQLLFPDSCTGPRQGSYLTFQAGDDPDVLGSAFACGVTQLGIRGCGMEQQLDAMLKAVTPPTSPLRFFNGSTGHGGPPEANTPNAGFLRNDAVLAVIIVTDEDDCSVPDANAELMSFGDGAYSSQPLNLRCGFFPDALHPVTRYREGLLALKPHNPELVIFGAITGIPTALEGESAEAILQNPVMEFRADRPETDPTYDKALPETSCTFPNPDYNPTDPTSEQLQKAYPPRRIVETAALFGENGVIRSLCQEEFTGALDAIIEKISDQLEGPCLPQPLIRNEEGLVECKVVEQIPDTGAGDGLCSAEKGRHPLGRRPIENEDTGVTTVMQLCSVDQVPVVNDVTQPNPETLQTVGWFYDDFSDATRQQCARQPQQIRYTNGAKPPPEAVVRLECVRSVSSAREGSRGRSAVGLSCEKDVNACAARSCDPAALDPDSRDCDKAYGLTCEMETNTCQIACGSDAQCPQGWRCHQDVEQGGLCVLPTCSNLSVGEVAAPGL